ncbi:MAG: ABC transporter permease [Anaerolineales bacterium]|jgi:ABC-2 type transport system permease protein
MNILNIPTALRVARKDIKIFLKERGTLLYLFVVPIVFILAFSGVSGVERSPKGEAITLPVVNLDAGSEASQTLIRALNQGGGIQCELYEQVEARSAFDEGTIKRMLTIPADYAVDLESGDVVTLQLENASDANYTRSEAVHRVVAGVAADLSLQSQLINSFEQMAAMQAGSSPEQQAFTTEIIIEQAQSQFERSRTEPLLGLDEIWPLHLQAKDDQETNPPDVFVPGFAVLFIFLTAQTTAQSIYEEKKIGSFRRLLAAPISKPTILLGKMAPNFITGLTQIIVLFGTGVFILPVLGLDSMAIGNDPLALVVMCLVILLCSASLGVFIAGIARTEAQISGLSQVVLWIFGFAGIWLDMIASISPFDIISKLIPHTWANQAFLDLFVRGQGLADIVPNIFVLLGFTLAFFAVGLWRFDYR